MHEVGRRRGGTVDEEVVPIVGKPVPVHPGVPRCTWPRPHARYGHPWVPMRTDARTVLAIRRWTGGTLFGLGSRLVRGRGSLVRSVRSFVRQSDLELSFSESPRLFLDENGNLVLDLTEMPVIAK